MADETGKEDKKKKTKTVRRPRIGLGVSPSWTQEALARFVALEGRLPHVDGAHHHTVTNQLNKARDLLDHPVPPWPWSRIANWWNGDHIERVWVYLEQAEIDIVEGSDDRGVEIALAIARQRAMEALKDTDPLRVALDNFAREGQPEGVESKRNAIRRAMEALKETDPLWVALDSFTKGAQQEGVESKRIAIQVALDASFAVNNNYHRAARALRNRLIVMTLIALFTAGATVVIQGLIPSATIIANANGTENISRWQLLLMVMAFGAIGGLLTTIRPISTMPPSGSPFNFPLQQALLKIIVGTLTATVGVIVVGGANVTRGFQSLPALIAAAVALGAGQQAVTQFLDKRATSLINERPTAG